MTPAKPSPAPLQVPSPRSSQRRFLALCALVLGSMTAMILWAARGRFVYSLDDPYIHLALARNLWLGHYGINPLEPAAPSSSLLWPFLLAPFAGSAHGDLAPLLINMACLMVSAWLLWRFFSQHFPPASTALLSSGVVWSLNLFGLAFTGMEHSLQVLLVTLVGVSLGGVAMPRWLFFAALVLLPFVRYEDLAISLPVLAWRAFGGELRASLIAGALIVAGLAAFSWFLHSQGLGWLPSSILAKQQVLSGLTTDPLSRILAAALNNLTAMLVYVLAIAAAAARLWRRDPARVAVLAVSTVLILLFGRTGWFGRYEVHFLMFATLMLAMMILPRCNRTTLERRAPLVVAAFAVANLGLWPVTLFTPASARNVSDQQLQMSLIVRDFLKAPIAVNDLGEVAYRGGQYVLDLWGLASRDALLARLSDPSGSWMSEAMTRHSIEFAFVYEDWFPQLPQNWIKVGELRLSSPPLAVAGDRVALFATTPAAAARLRDALLRYQAGSPEAASLLSLTPG